MSKYKKVQQSKITVQEVLQDGQVHFEIPERGINKETIEHFGVRMLQDIQNPTYKTYFFPVTKRGEITGFIKVDPQRSKKDGRFTTVGDVSIESDLLGQNVAGKTGTKRLFVVEGFWDTLSAYQSLRESVKGTAYAKLLPNVVSPALGIGDINKGPTNARQQISNNIDFINKYQQKIVCFDNDPGEVNVGQMGVQDCSLVLKDFLNVILDKNDCNEMMRSEGPIRLAKALNFEGVPYQPESIIVGGVDQERLTTPIEKGTKTSCLPVLMGMWRGVRSGEITTILAPSGVGKSTLCREIGYDLLSKGIPTGFIFLEETIEKTQQSMIALDNNVWLPDYREDPSIISKEQFNKSYEKLLSQDRSAWLAHFGSLTSSTLMQKMEWMANRGFERILLDHLSVVISGQESKNERKDIDILMTNLAEFVTRTGVSLYLVSHIKRLDKKVYVKDAQGRKFLHVSMDLARGSAALEQLSFNIMTLEPEATEDGRRGCFRIRSEKCREVGTLGVADYLKLHPKTGRVEPFNPNNEGY